MAPRYELNIGDMPEEEPRYNCSFCGEFTYHQPGNPFPVEQPLGRCCARCLPGLLESLRARKPLMQIVSEAARERKSRG